MTAAVLKTISRADMLTGTERAAVLVMYLDHDVARHVLENFTAAELKQIGMAMARVEMLGPGVIEDVVAHFVRDLTNASMVPKTGTDFALNVLPELIDEGRRPRIVGALRRELSTEFHDYLCMRSATTIAAIVRDEHPQTRAVAMLLMGTENASRVLAELTEQERLDITLRMSRLEQIPGELADDVESSILAALADREADRVPIKGVDATAKILGRLDVDDQQGVLDRIARTDADLSDTLRRRMVVFDDLIRLSDRAMQTLLKNVDRDTLVLALRGAEQGVMDLVLRNMSTRAAQDTAEEIEILGPLPRETVETAREELVQIVLRLKEDGSINLPLGGGDGDLM